MGSVSKTQLFVILCVVSSISALTGFLVHSVKTKSSGETLFSKEWVASQIGLQVQEGQFPQSIQQNWTVNYTFDPNMQDTAESLLRHFQPDYAAIVALDAASGRILAMTSTSRAQLPKNFAVAATFPAASIFKLVTATAALDQNLVTPDTILPFNGAHHTLYKRNVMKTDLNRWTNYITLKDAFGHSVNTFFGKLGLFHVGSNGLAKYAERFGFNRQIPADFPIEMAVARLDAANDVFEIAETASGFTRNTTLTPVQGALMAASVVNNGIMMEPYIVDSIIDQNQTMIYQAKPQVLGMTMKFETSQHVRELMRNTVERGTSRKAFRALFLSRKAEEVDLGGKTGSLTGLSPKGRTDWFIGYMNYKNQRIAFAAVSVHEKLWRVRSSQLASEFFKKYLGEPKISVPPSAVISTHQSDGDGETVTK